MSKPIIIKYIPTGESVTRQMPDKCLHSDELLNNKLCVLCLAFGADMLHKQHPEIPYRDCLDKAYQLIPDMSYCINGNITEYVTTDRIAAFIADQAKL